jgi:diguanylate cyclase (GGDEF)-like protein
LVIVLCAIVLIDPDRAFELLAARREAQFDEGLTSVVIVGVAFAIFAWRRWSDVSRQVAEYKRLQKELSVFNHEAARLRETDDLLQVCVSAEESYEVVVGHLKAELPALSGAICMMTAAKDLIEVRTQWGTPVLAERVFSPEDCWGLRRGRSKVRRGGETELICRHIGASGPAYAICIPMTAQGETQGLLYLDSGVASTSAFSQELSQSEQRMVTTLAEHLASAVANLNLRERLRMQSIRDPLTDLYNRRHMEESLDRELRRSDRKDQPLSVMMVDIDHFKRFNDSYGHEVGDVLLQELARLFRRHLRTEDVACRYGGEEFTLIFPETTLESAIERAEALCQIVRTTDVQYRGKNLPRFSISVGVASSPQHGSVREMLLQSADGALYQAKEQGRDRVVAA